MKPPQVQPKQSDRSDMLVKRVSAELTIDLDKEKDAKALYAVLLNDPSLVSPEDFALGRRMYDWFFESVKVLATNYPQETETKYFKNLKR